MWYRTTHTIRLWQHMLDKVEESNSYSNNNIIIIIVNIRVISYPSTITVQQPTTTSTRRVSPVVWLVVVGWAGWWVGRVVTEQQH